MQALLDYATTAPEECVLWRWSTTCGYGIVQHEGRSQHATHVVLQMVGQHRPTDKHEVCHSCDTPACINVAHLRWGTRTENMADMRERGRSRTGLRHWNCRLTDDQVRDIRRRYKAGEPPREIARDFGITPPHVTRVATGKRRPTVTDQEKDA